MQNRQTLIKSIISTMLIIGGVRLFGPLPSLVGYGVGLLVYRLLSKSNPNGNLPLVMGIVVGVVAALAAGMAFVIMLRNLY